MLFSPITMLDVQEASMLIEDDDIFSTEGFKLPRDTAYGMEADVPDLVYKKVAIKPAPFLQKTPEPPLPQPPAPQQDERHANGLVEGQPLAPIPLQTSMEADCQDQFAQQQLLQAPDTPRQVQEGQDHHPLHDRAESHPPSAVQYARPRRNTRPPFWYTDYLHLH